MKLSQVEGGDIFETAYVHVGSEKKTEITSVSAPFQTSIYPQLMTIPRRDGIIKLCVSCFSYRGAGQAFSCFTEI